MTDAVRFPLVLGVISVVSAGVLGLTYSSTRGEIQYQALLDRNRALVNVLGVVVESPESPPWTTSDYAEGTGPLGAFTVYQAVDPATGKALYATQGVGQGYSSKVRVMVAVNDGIKQDADHVVIRAVEVVQQRETPGLGSQCQDADFQAEFAGLPLRLLAIDRAMTAYREPNAGGEQQIAAITGATITTNAVAVAIRQAVARIRFHVEQQGTGT